MVEPPPGEWFGILLANQIIENLTRSANAEEFLVFVNTLGKYLTVLTINYHCCLVTSIRQFYFPYSRI